MNATDYERAKSSPDVFSGWQLETTETCLRAIGSSLAEAIAAMTRVAIPKPSLHSNEHSLFFRLDLPVKLVSEIVDDLGSAEAAAVSADGTTTPEASRRGDLLDRWFGYQRWLERCEN